MQPDQTTGPGTRRRRCNALDGKQWLRNSISVRSDVAKRPEEKRLKHPAMFSIAFAERLIDTFLPPTGDLILDPFAGSGTTLVAAESRGKRGIGIELSPEYVRLINSRTTSSQGVLASASDLLQFVSSESVDLCITSPPYWDILNQRRTADGTESRHYGNLDGDLGNIASYDDFVTALVEVFRQVFTALKPGRYCCANVMDLRKKDRFLPLHMDLAVRLQEVGFVFDDLIIWNRQSEYNNLRPLGFPSVFRINRVHEFVLLMRKPKAATDAAE